jgi:hypothetical protein
LSKKNPFHHENADKDQFAIAELMNWWTNKSGFNKINK